jgi:hypothetical protein
MKKILLLSVLAVFASPVFAQLLTPDTIPGLLKDTRNPMSKQVAIVLEREWKNAKEANQPFPNTEVKNIEYKPGSSISLMPFHGQPISFKIALPEGKKAVLKEKSYTFLTGYNRYDFRFDFKVEQNYLLVLITPKEKVEPLEGTIRASVSLPDASTTDGAISLHLKAVTMDDVNSGLGWGEVRTIAFLK